MENSIGSFIIRPSLGDSFISGMNILYEEQDMEMKLKRKREMMMSRCFIEEKC